MTEQNTPDIENDALKAALAGYSPTQIQAALDCIAAKRYREYAGAPGGAVGAWLVQSRSRPNMSYAVVDDGDDVLWCPCAASGRCWHRAVAIMLRVHAEHTEPKHRTWCPGYKANATARASDPVCCDLDKRTDANKYDSFAVFDRL